MAVARIKANRAWFKRAAGQVPESPKLVRELLRAADRPGRTAELMGDEIRLLWVRRPEDPLVKEAYDRLRAAEERERDTHREIQNLMNMTRGEEL